MTSSGRRGSGAARCVLLRLFGGFASLNVEPASDARLAHRAARSKRGRDHSRLRAPSPRGRHQRQPGALRLSGSAADGQCEARRRVPSGFVCNPRTCTSAHQDASCGSHRPNPDREGAETAPEALAAQARSWRRTWWIDVGVGRHDVEIPREHDRRIEGVELGPRAPRAASSRRAYI